jgi:hypothetical protein
MTEDVLQSTRPPIEVPSAGGEEPYFLDSVHAGEINLAAVDLANTIRDWFNYEKKPEELALDDPNEKPVIKVVPPNGATAKPRRRTSGTHRSRRAMQPSIGDRVPHLEHLILQKYLLPVPRP